MINLKKKLHRTGPPEVHPSALSPFHQPSPPSLGLLSTSMDFDYAYWNMLIKLFKHFPCKVPGRVFINSSWGEFCIVHYLRCIYLYLWKSTQPCEYGLWNSMIKTYADAPNREVRVLFCSMNCKLFYAHNCFVSGSGFFIGINISWRFTIDNTDAQWFSFLLYRF